MKPQPSPDKHPRRAVAPLGWLPLRGASGRLYGYLDPLNQIIEFKRKGEDAERIEIKDLLKR
jgi:hypothetical protein